MARKDIIAQVKVQIPGGKASPAPPVGTTLGPHGLNLQEFCAAFNDRTKDRAGEVTPVVVTVYADRSFDLLLKTPPAAELLKKAAKVEKGSGEPGKRKVGTVTRAQVREIAERKMEDLNAADVERAMRVIEGTARSMGIVVKE